MGHCVEGPSEADCDLWAEGESDGRACSFLPLHPRPQGWGCAVHHASDSTLRVSKHTHSRRQTAHTYNTQHRDTIHTHTTDTPHTDTTHNRHTLPTNTTLTIDLHHLQIPHPQQTCTTYKHHTHNRQAPPTNTTLTTDIYTYKYHAHRHHTQRDTLHIQIHIYDTQHIT